MANMTAYEASSLDRSASTSLAKRAAQETPLKPAPRLGYLNHRTNEYIELLGPHWVLDHRMQNSEGSYGAHNEEDHTNDVYALLPDGELVYVQVIEEIWTFPSGGSPVYKDRDTLRKMTDSDVQDFDFTKERYSLNGVWGDTIWASHGRGALVHDSKGAGLFRRLEDVLAGRHENLPGPLGLHKESTPPKPTAKAGSRGPQSSRAVQGQKDPTKKAKGAAYGVLIGVAACIVLAIIWPSFPPFLFLLIVIGGGVVGLSRA
ncbi:hypothetical protein MycrhDRAFT_5536 [Mycolicibacterium rhodesiae JS60]|nr:hypothetical protein MycrhDRAFT_5536 [Mycolicibacterium rhodesiae JS60]